MQIDISYVIHLPIIHFGCLRTKLPNDIIICLLAVKSFLLADVLLHKLTMRNNIGLEFESNWNDIAY